MHFFRVLIAGLLLALEPLTHGCTLPRALNKANEYPELDCLDKSGTNKPTWAHTPSLCACVTLYSSDASAYLVAMKGQRMLAFSNQNCNPGKDGVEGLGELSGGCAMLDTQFEAARMGSVFWYTPVICEIADAINGEFEVFVADSAKMMYGAIDL